MIPPRNRALMKCSSAHGALQAEQQPVVEVAGVIETVLVADQGGAQGAQLQEPMPIGVVASQAGHLEAEHDPRSPHSHFCNEALEPFPVGGRRPGVTLVAVDHHHLIDCPAHGDRPLAQPVLAGRRLGVGQHLAQRRLADIEIGGAGQMGGGDLVGDLGAHRGSPRSDH
jgi:hypothetical protein